MKILKLNVCKWYAYKLQWIEHASEEAEHLRKQLEEGRVQAELECLRALERALSREQAQVDIEQEHAKTLATEKLALEEKVKELSMKLTVAMATTELRLQVV